VTRPRVLWLIKGLGLGGAERLLATMAGKVDRERFDIEVAYLLPWSERFGPEFEAIGVETICLDARWTAELGWPSRLRRLLRTRRYDLIHTHSPVPAVAARVLAPAGTRLVHTEHNVWGGYRSPTYLANAATFGRNAAVFAVSEAVHNSIVQPRWLAWSPMPPVETLRHGVDLDRLHRGIEARAAARATLGLADCTPVIGSVASFTPQKDHGGLIAAFQRLRSRVPDVLLLLMGSGPLEMQVARLAAESGLGNHVMFLGARTDVTALLPALDIFVLGSRFEGLPISLLEAMGSQVACVATEVGGIPEALRSGREGWLVPPMRPEALADALAHVLADRALRERLATGGYERVAADFSIDRAVRRTHALYEEVLR
jgi:glycosyltransferase involved in cell wall biosynthesis